MATRSLYTRPAPIKLRNIEHIQAFAQQLREFTSVFQHSLPTSVTFCNIQVLQLVISEGLSFIIHDVFTCLSHSLSQLNVMVNDDSVGGTHFMKILGSWAKLLPKLKILRIKYEFFADEDVRYISPSLN